MPPWLQAITTTAGVVATLGAAYLGLRERKPKVQADVASAAVHDALESLKTALVQANEDGAAHRSRLTDALADVDRWQERVGELERELDVVTREVRSLERQRDAQLIEIAQLRKAGAE